MTTDLDRAINEFSVVNADTRNAVFIELGGRPIAVNQNPPGAGGGSSLTGLCLYAFTLLAERGKLCE